jgi:hypothetical protein
MPAQQIQWTPERAAVAEAAYQALSSLPQAKWIMMDNPVLGAAALGAMIDAERLVRGANLRTATTLDPVELLALVQGALSIVPDQIGSAETAQVARSLGEVGRIYSVLQLTVRQMVRTAQEGVRRGSPGYHPIDFGGATAYLPVAVLPPGEIPAAMPLAFGPIVVILGVAAMAATAWWAVEHEQAASRVQIESAWAFHKAWSDVRIALAQVAAGQTVTRSDWAGARGAVANAVDRPWFVPALLGGVAVTVGVVAYATRPKTALARRRAEPAPEPNPRRRRRRRNPVPQVTETRTVRRTVDLPDPKRKPKPKPKRKNPDPQTVAEDYVRQHQFEIQRDVYRLGTDVAARKHMKLAKASKQTDQWGAKPRWRGITMRALRRAFLDRGWRKGSRVLATDANPKRAPKGKAAPRARRGAAKSRS